MKNQLLTTLFATAVALVATHLPVQAQVDIDEAEVEQVVTEALRELLQSEKKQVTYVKLPKTYSYRVQFKDKNGTPYSVKHPAQFLSPKALERRARYGLKVETTDLPLTPAYLQQLASTGVKLGNQSKWNNSVVVTLPADTSALQQVRALPFVQSIRRVAESPDSVPENSLLVAQTNPNDRQAEITATQPDTLYPAYYGKACDQNNMLDVAYLHQKGYEGQGITIGILDGGFHNVDLIAGLRNAQILGTRNFVRPNKNVYEELSHGMMVLSCIAAKEPGYLVGTAPKAAFYLLQSEDGESEQMVEEDNWVAALEYADSIGCDVVTSSLGYNRYDHKYMNYRYAELDGHTALISRMASMAASKGIFLLNSAGNEGDETWKKIGVPADARNMLTVGAVSRDSVNTAFSSIGYTADGRVKPDVMAMGADVTVYDVDGNLTEVDGTSFSTPLLCGAAACLVQAFPKVRPEVLQEAIRQSGNNATTPDNVYGYGIPSMKRAAQWLQSHAAHSLK